MKPTVWKVTLVTAGPLQKMTPNDNWAHLMSGCPEARGYKVWANCAMT